MQEEGDESGDDGESLESFRTLSSCSLSTFLFAFDLKPEHKRALLLRNERKAKYVKQITAGLLNQSIGVLIRWICQNQCKLQFN